MDFQETAGHAGMPAFLLGPAEPEASAFIRLAEFPYISMAFCKPSLAIPRQAQRQSASKGPMHVPIS
jgi:hypothetical protein